VILQYSKATAHTRTLGFVVLSSSSWWLRNRIFLRQLYF